METEIRCPRCGGKTFYVYRTESGDFAGCEHCAEFLNKAVGYYDMRDRPEDYAPPKVRCPVCGELCRKVYRKAKNGDFVGCDVCVYELDAVADADANPNEYGLEETL